MKDVFKVTRSADSDDVLRCLNGQFYNVINVCCDNIRGRGFRFNLC